MALRTRAETEASSVSVARTYLCGSICSMPGPMRRLRIILAGIFFLALIAGITVFSLSPLGLKFFSGLNPGFSGSNVQIVSRTNATQNGAQLTATAAAYQSTNGYDPNASGGQSTTDGSYSLSWPVGQCTYWANVRYHMLTRHWVSWHGNADQWVTGARAAGWNVSQTPHVPSIIVLMPYVQGASGYGGVAVVESIVHSGSPATVNTSIMNWPGNGGGWDRVSYANFNTGTGVYFIWHP